MPGFFGFHVCRAFYDLSGINIYHIFADVCVPARASASAHALANTLQRHRVPLHSTSEKNLLGRRKFRDNIDDYDGDHGACWCWSHACGW